MGLNINSNAVPPLTQAAGSRSEPSRGFLGVLMLDTRFPRPLGDVGLPETFTALGIEARFHVVIGAGADENTPTVGVSSDSELQRQILGNRATLDEAQASDNVVQAARNLLEREPRISFLVLECTNMPPYADALRRATGRPVEHLPSLVQELWKET